MILDWIEWEGPLVTEAEKSRRKDVVPPDDATPEVVAARICNASPSVPGGGR